MMKMQARLSSMKKFFIFFLLPYHTRSNRISCNMCGECSPLQSEWLVALSLVNEAMRLPSSTEHLLVHRWFGDDTCLPSAEIDYSEARTHSQQLAGRRAAVVRLHQRRYAMLEIERGVWAVLVRNWEQPHQL
jgi:hypothetical protein